MSVDEAQVRAVAEAVTDPELRRSLGELGMVRSVSVKRKRVTVDLAVPVGQYPQVEDLVGRVREAVGALKGVDEVGGEVAVMTEEERRRVRLLLRGEPLDGGVSAYADENGHDHGGHDHGGHSQGGQLGHEEGRPNRFMLPRSRTRVIGISSGKGGVGKSSVTVNLAVALAQQGHDVGILDADVYGFSVPKMLGVRTDPVIIDDLVIPPIVHGVRCLSMGFFVPDETLVDAYWGEPDFLLVDMPPGTGDVTLSLGQYLTKTEVFVVTTPQAAAQRVAQRSAYAARKLKLAVRGVIENMSWFTGDDGTRYELFGSGGGTSLARELGVPLMAQIPLVPALRQGGDIGVPVMVADPDGEAAKAFTRLAEQMVGLGPARVYRQELTVH
jgi:ATP-binding protein involved in chromosome partitioning